MFNQYSDLQWLLSTLKHRLLVRFSLFSANAFFAEVTFGSSTKFSKQNSLTVINISLNYTGDYRSRSIGLTVGAERVSEAQPALGVVVEQLVASVAHYQSQRRELEMLTRKPSSLSEMSSVELHNVSFCLYFLMPCRCILCF